MAKVSIKGVLLGGILDIVSSMILGIPLVVYAIASANLVNVPKDQLGAAITASIHARPPLYALQLLIGAACTTFGAYMSARIAKHDELLNGFLSSFVCVLTGIYAVASGKDTSSTLTLIGLFALTLASGLFGGYLRARSVAKRALLAGPV
ncbi:MAG TPA: hypothetical protein VGA84_15275 [Thermoanaerobaculia bacterium]